MEDMRPDADRDADLLWEHTARMACRPDEYLRAVHWCWERWGENFSSENLAGIWSSYEVALPHWLGSDSYVYGFRFKEIDHCVLFGLTWGS